MRMSSKDLPFFGRINDAHTHLWDGKLLQNRFSPSEPETTLGSAEMLLHHMDQFGINRSLIITPTTLGFDNSLVLELSKAYSDRFIPIARVDLSSPLLLRRLDSLLAAGVKGIRISINEWTNWDLLTREPSTSLWSKLALARIPLLVHSALHQLTFIEEISSANPRLTILLDHMARPNVSSKFDSPDFQALMGLAKYSNVHVKLSSMNYFSSVPESNSDLIPFVRSILANFPKERLLWGSDWPLADTTGGFERSFEPLLSLQEEISDDYMRCIFSETFEGIFG
jgi:L-fuconolactonase